MGNPELNSCSTADELARAVAGAWLGEVAVAQRAGQPHCVALSGGRITQKFFAAVVAAVREGRHAGDPNIRAGGTPSLPNVHFFWADERCVPPTDTESNFKMADELLFQPLKISASQIHRIQGELTPERAAFLATNDICQTVPAVLKSKGFTINLHPPFIHYCNNDQKDEAIGKPTLDLIFLGMGEDGHVASLFPGEPEADRANPAVFRAIMNSPKPPPNRVTLGYGAIAAAKQVWVLAAGAGKEAALRESLSPAGQTPLARVLRARSNTKVFSDIRL